MAKLLEPSTLPRAYLTYYQDKAGKHRWRIKARNGQVLGSSSQGYKTREDCFNNAVTLAAALGAVVDHNVSPKWVGMNTGSRNGYPLYF